MNTVSFRRPSVSALAAGLFCVAGGVAAPRWVDAAEIAPLVPVAIGQRVQMHVPGFTAVELPVQVTALNNLEYAPDGRLFAGGYDGRYHLLRDTNGDGLEDTVDTFSDQVTDDYPLGMVVKDGMPHALLSDELIRFRDTDGDGVPNRRETVLKGWDDPRLKTNAMLMHRRVDYAMALAAGPDGAWYVTMGSANPGNGYWQEAKGDIWNPNTAKTGTPHYSTDKLRGCLLRLTPDGKPELLASGLRYIMSLQFNRHGDLFGTDQEGATWLPNGNPFDELLHIQTGRHYGFPPRHPVLLPNVVDEPSVWDYAPQHQSTCGFRFNTPTTGRGRFGPEFWTDNALVVGASRGKLWRTALAKTAAGYVARTELIATLGMLAIDCAIAPDGSLVVACHDGPPDWGKGPAANGKLFKIRFSDPASPQPVLTWAASETKTVVQFDRPLDAGRWSDLAKKVGIEFGAEVAAADRFEPFRPGYAVVKAQENTPRYRLAVSGARLGANGSSMEIDTPARREATGYAVTLKADGGDIDLAHDLGGVAATWHGSDGATWNGWWPAVDLAAVREFTRSSPTHADLAQVLQTPGTLTLRGQLDLWNMLRPAVQPGSTLDYVPEPERVTVSFRADAALELRAEGAVVEQPSSYETRLTQTPQLGRWLPVTLTVRTPLRSLDVSWFTALDARPRALGVKRFQMPFAQPPSGAAAKKTVVPEIAGGDWAKGRELFLGKATCAQCHLMRGEGHAVGPDLSNSPHRDYASVLRDIREPSATLNPDAVAYTVTLKDGTEIAGVRSGETDTALELKQAGGLVARVAKKDIATREANPESLMPPGLIDGLSPQEIKDLMAYLLTEPAEKN